MALVQSISIIPTTTTVVASALSGLCSTAEVPSGIRVAQCTCSGSTERIRRKRDRSETRETLPSQKAGRVGESFSPQVVSVSACVCVCVAVLDGRREELSVIGTTAEGRPHRILGSVAT